MTTQMYDNIRSHSLVIERRTQLIINQSFNRVESLSLYVSIIKKK